MTIDALLLSCFSSVAFARDVPAPTQRSIEDIGNWIGAYFDWHAEVAGIIYSSKPQLLYQRSLSIIGKGTYRDFKVIQPLIELASNRSVPVVLQLS
jgi:hypothetical protein